MGSCEKSTPGSIPGPPGSLFHAARTGRLPYLLAEGRTHRIADIMSKRILFLCTGNSCRSQMAEGWTRALWGPEFEAYSAGTIAKGLDPRAVAAMAESGVDISEQESKKVEDLADLEFDLVVTVCSDADSACPAFPGPVTKLHRAFDDPPRLAAGARSEDQALVHYRRVRDEIRAFAASLPDILAGLPKS